MVIKTTLQYNMEYGNDAFPHTIQYKFISLRSPKPLISAFKSCWLLSHSVPFGVMFLCNAVGHVGSDGAHLSRSFYVKHLIVKVDVRPDLLQHGAFRCSCKEQGLVNLQAPGPECLQRPDPRAGCTSSCDQVCSDGTVKALAFSIELFLELPQCLQEALKGTLSERKTEVINSC